MIKAIQFKNFKALRDTTLPLGRLTLLVGPNGSGKSTALSGLDVLRVPLGPKALSVGVRVTRETVIQIGIEWSDPPGGSKSQLTWKLGGRSFDQVDRNGRELSPPVREQRQGMLHSVRIYSLNATALAGPVTMVPNIELKPDGHGLTGVLERLRDDAPERFEALNEEFGRWLPEFDRVLFETPSEGKKAIKLRTRDGQHAIPAADISQGTLLALAILTLAYLPDPPPIIGLEEPGRGIHPRLLRDVHDAMYRLAYPESVGEQREPVQVVATTHSPYLLDLFRDHPEEIVIADKVEGNVRFTRLTDIPNYQDILADAALGEVWYSGALGGVPGNR